MAFKPFIEVTEYKNKRKYELRTSPLQLFHSPENIKWVDKCDNKIIKLLFGSFEKRCKKAEKKLNKRLEKMRNNSNEYTEIETYRLDGAPNTEQGGA